MKNLYFIAPLFIASLGLLMLFSCKPKNGDKKNEPVIAIDKITLSSTSLDLKLGEKKLLAITILPAEATDKTIEWTSDNETVVKVSGGEVAALKNGTATVTAKSKSNSDKTASCKVTVKSDIASIALGDEKFDLKALLDNATTTLNNAPRTLLTNIADLPVNITVAAGSSIKIGANAFIQGQKVDFSAAKTFVVTTQGGIQVSYTIAIPTYNRDSNPYGVYTARHLNDVRNDLSASFKMMNNITLPARDAAGADATGIHDYATAGWLPIAHEVTMPATNTTTVIANITGGFTGIFDGGNFVIDNLYINRSSYPVGLFAVASKAIIKNLGVAGTATQAITGARFAGAIAGFMEYSSLTNCNSSGKVTATAEDSYAGGLVGYVMGGGGGKISNCFATGDVASKYYAGGLIGEYYHSKSMSLCYATGNVTVSDAANAAAGGLIGSISPYSSSPSYTTDPISKCYATGNIVVFSTGSSRAGGLLGGTAVKIKHCYATGNVTLSNTTGTARAGGLSATCSANISNCYATGNVTASADNKTSSGGFVASNEGSAKDKTKLFTKCVRNKEAVIKKDNAITEPLDTAIPEIEGKTKKEMQEDSFTTYLNDGADVWERNNSKNNGMPTIKGL